MNSARVRIIRFDGIRLDVSSFLLVLEICLVMLSFFKR